LTFFEDYRQLSKDSRNVLIWKKYVTKAIGGYRRPAEKVGGRADGKSSRESLFYAAFQASTGLRSLTVKPDGKAVKEPEEASMLTDAALRDLKPKSKTYKASDRDGRVAPCRH
jgi:hypothetical protein